MSRAACSALLARCDGEWITVGIAAGLLVATLLASVVVL